MDTPGLRAPHFIGAGLAMIRILDLRVPLEASRPRATFIRQALNKLPDGVPDFAGVEAKPGHVRS
jgi:hypothetical protein